MSAIESQRGDPVIEAACGRSRGNERSILVTGPQIDLDGARFELFIDQTQKVSHGDGLVGDGTVTWRDRDGERTDPLLVQGQGEAQFVFELQRGISGSYSQPVGTIYFSATLDEAHAAATGVLSGDDHYGLRFDSEALVLFR